MSEQPAIISGCRPVLVACGATPTRAAEQPSGSSFGSGQPRGTISRNRVGQLRLRIGRRNCLTVGEESSALRATLWKRGFSGMAHSRRMRHNDARSQSRRALSLRSHPNVLRNVMAAPCAVADGQHPSSGSHHYVLDEYADVTRMSIDSPGMRRLWRLPIVTRGAVPEDAVRDGRVGQTPVRS